MASAAEAYSAGRGGGTELEEESPFTMGPGIA